MPPTPTAADVETSAAPPSLDDASARLESALARLEALVEAGPLQSEQFRTRKPGPPGVDATPGPEADALKAQLDAAQRRERALEAAAAAASEALGHAMAEVRRALDAGGDDGLEEEDDEAEPVLPLDLEPVEGEDEAS